MRHTKFHNFTVNVFRNIKKAFSEKCLHDFFKYLTDHTFIFLHMFRKHAVKYKQINYYVIYILIMALTVNFVEKLHLKLGCLPIFRFSLKVSICIDFLVSNLLRYKLTLTFSNNHKLQSFLTYFKLLLYVTVSNG